MSSETPTSQQLYEAERLRALTLEKRSVRLQAEVAKLRAELDRLEIVETELEFREEAKDATIQRLQTALDDRPSASGDVKEVMELRAKIERLEVINKDAIHWLSEVMRENWNNIKPVVEQHLRMQRDTARLQSQNLEKELERTRAELTGTNAELASTKTELTGMKIELNALRALKESFRSILARYKRTQSLIGSMGSGPRQHKSENSDSSTNLDPAPLTTRRRDEPRATSDESFSAGAKEISTSVMRDSIQDCSAEQSASHGPRVPKSSVELEQLRLKDRKTLHRLDIV